MNPTEKLARHIVNNDKKFQKLKNKHYPLQYIIGNTEFYGFNILVNKHVLIPRFETEELVEKTINLLNKYNFHNLDILELGTGSGCISIALASLLKNVNIDAIDISKQALKVAKQNAIHNNVQINFIKKNIIKYKSTKKYDLIISNPPYLTKHDEIDIGIKYEPKISLFAKDDGNYFYKYILQNYKNNLKDDSIIAFETNTRNHQELEHFAKQIYPTSEIIFDKDLSNKDRYMFVINKSE